MIAQSRAERTWEINNYGKYINQFPPNTIKSIRQYERINKKIWRPKMSIIFNEICIYIYIYIYIYMDLALNNLQWLICHKTKRNLTNISLYIDRYSYVCMYVCIYLSLGFYMYVVVGFYTFLSIYLWMLIFTYHLIFISIFGYLFLSIYLCIIWCSYLLMCCILFFQLSRWPSPKSFLFFSLSLLCRISHTAILHFCLSFSAVVICTCFLFFAEMNNNADSFLCVPYIIVYLFTATFTAYWLRSCQKSVIRV